MSHNFPCSPLGGKLNPTCQIDKTILVGYILGHKQTAEERINYLMEYTLTYAVLQLTI